MNWITSIRIGNQRTRTKQTTLRNRLTPLNIQVNCVHRITRNVIGESVYAHTSASWYDLLGDHEEIPFLRFKSYEDDWRRYLGQFLFNGNLTLLFCYRGKNVLEIFDDLMRCIILVSYSLMEIWLYCFVIQVKIGWRFLMIWCVSFCADLWFDWWMFLSFTASRYVVVRFLCNV